MDNLRQISNLLGQQELEGKRVPFMESGKTLPCFRKYELTPAAGGYIFERFLTGVNPATFYFHSMAGREGLIDTAVKTANSGYLQRCLAKLLEGVFIQSDYTVKNDEKIIQFKYGDDGIDCTRGTYLQNIDFYKNNLNIFIHSNSRDSNLGTVKYDDLISNNFINFIDNCEDKIKDFMKGKYLNSLANPGHSVGIIAAQSVGEPSTQMTLNTFHFAGVGGKNVTLGIPRLREIIMTASKTIKTPIIVCKASSPEAGLRIADFLKIIDLESCLDKITITEKMVVRNFEYKKHFKIIFDIKSEIDACIKIIDKDFLKRLGYFLRKKLSSSGIVEYNDSISKTLGVEGNSEESSSSEEENDDENIKADVMDVAQDDIEDVVEDDGFLENIDEESKVVEDCVDVPLINLKKISQNKFCFDIYYPSDFDLLLMPLVEEVVKLIVVKEVPGFKRVTSEGTNLFFEGSDFLGLARLLNRHDLEDQVDFYSCECNDIYSIYKYFGVEGARQAIVNEIRGVFDVYGIKIDIRHLYLISDFMTRDGTYKAFRRTSFTMDDSFIQKMSFESCFNNLKNAAIFHQKDTVANPSSSLLAGNNLRSGTGFFEI